MVDNPADIGSRGILASELKTSLLWWNGPEWLCEADDKWPVAIVESTLAGAEEERSTSTMVVHVCQSVDIANIIDIRKFSGMVRLLKVTAYVKRFAHNIGARRAGLERRIGMLSRRELQDAEIAWIKSAQTELKRGIHYNQLTKQLDLVEENNLIKCRGRLENAELEIESREPLVLPRDHRLTELVILECHKGLHHSGVRATLTQLRTRFWVPKGRQVVKKLIGRCVTCKKLEGKAYKSPPTAELPDFRITQSDPFAKVGVDFAGPLYYKSSSGMQKAYVALFSCCVTRALYLDLVKDLETTTFRRCLRRFAARKGTPTLIVSDNAKTFKATRKALQELYNHPEIRGYLEANMIDWKFNLEKTPWWGGFYERMVGSVKRCLRKTLGGAKFTYDELLTALVEIESTLNDRPLTYVYDEVGEIALTPSHLVYGRRINGLPDKVDEPDDVVEDGHHLRFKYLSQKLAHFWQRWRKEYITSLREFHRVNTNKENGEEIRVGDVVIVFEEGKKRNEWKMAVVERLIHGKGVVRGARVRLMKGGKPSYLDRPVQKLYPIEVRYRNGGQDVQAGREPAENKLTVSRPARDAVLQARARIASQAGIDSGESRGESVSN